MIYITGTNRIYSWLLRFFMKFDYMGKNVIIAPSCDIHRRTAPYIHLGNNVSMSKDVWLNIPYEASPPVKGKPVIRIGNGVAIGRRCTISGVHRIEIGEKALFGPSVFITDHSHEFEDPFMPITDQGITEGGTIIIEDGCWFGHNSAVVAHRGREVRIGRNSIIGANAVVTRSFPVNSVLIGNPARNVGRMSRIQRGDSPASDSGLNP
jgi:acetyltransferase-like isoleucine patch superfamily enzyme